VSGIPEIIAPRCEALPLNHSQLVTAGAKPIYDLTPGAVSDNVASLVFETVLVLPINKANYLYWLPPDSVLSCCPRQ
jgi:hypothetical protein